MATAFPALRPVSRSYTPGQFPTKRFNSMNGSGVTRLYGNVSFDATMSLQFIVNDLQLKSITTCYESARGGYDDLTLPDDVFSGMDAGYFPNHLKWRWAESPSVESIQGDLSQVTVSLIATLEVT